MSEREQAKVAGWLALMFLIPMAVIVALAWFMWPAHAQPSMVGQPCPILYMTGDGKLWTLTPVSKGGHVEYYILTKPDQPPPILK